ncbi:uncharacterized protein LOC124917295 [Impatiens glandulifera]|uniref:uncharacterized protein LOC124917295 n=1 Tax=Impatiens glandulifera TaxID=253017 RepID=UPI001FB11D99|nr:uncharacterized protein LOC124917295 [Impatiens glandulifera]
MESVAEVLHLPTEGSDFSVYINEVAFQAVCRDVSDTEMPIAISGKKTSLKPELRPLCEILTKSVQARGGNYDSLTRMKIDMIAGLVNDTKINWAKTGGEEGKTKVSGNTSGRRKTTAKKKKAPAKEKSGSKADKQPTGSTNPQSDIINTENSSSSSGRTASHHTGEDRTGKGKEPMVEEQSARTDNVDAGSGRQQEENETADEHIQQMGEDLVNQIMKEIDEQAHAASDVYFKWALNRQEIFYKNMLPEHPTNRKFEKLVEMEAKVINLTKAQSTLTALRRSRMVEPHARLLGLTEHIQLLQRKHILGTSDSQFELLVLDMLAVKEQELTEELARLEAEPEHQEASVFSRFQPEDEGGPNPAEDEHISPPPEQEINNTELGTGTPPTNQHISLQTDNESVPTITEHRVKDLIEEFVNAAILSWQKKIKETATKSIEMIESTNKELETAVGRITSVEDKYDKTDLLYSDTTDRTKVLVAATKKLETDLALTSQKVGMAELNQLTTDQRLKKIDGDLAQSGVQAGSTLERVTMLEEKHAKTEADLKAVTEQLAEMIAAKLAADKALEEANELAAQKIQDALDEQTRLQKETEEADANLAGHMQTLKNIAPAIAVQQNEDAARLIGQQLTYNEFAEAHKKSKAVASPSGPVTRKRKASTKRAAISKLLDNVTEAVSQEDDDLEEEIVPLNKRPRGLDVIPIRSFAPPAPLSPVLQAVKDPSPGLFQRSRERTQTVEEYLYVVFDEPGESNSIDPIDLADRLEATSLDSVSEKEALDKQLSLSDLVADPVEIKIDVQTPIQQPVESSDVAVSSVQTTNPFGSNFRWNKNHPPELIIGNLFSPRRTR